MNTGKIIADLRNEKKWSQTELADQSEVSRVMIGKYEREEAIPSIEAAKKIADAFEVSLDYLVGEGMNAKLDKKTLQRLEDIQLLDENKQHTLFDLIDTYIQNYKSKQAFK
jgi:transcriptional regulator with XRE-family HTH domain